MIWPRPPLSRSSMAARVRLKMNAAIVSSNDTQASLVAIAMPSRMAFSGAA
jgi:hypothetical protein